MKKLFLIICIAILWSCNKKEKNVVKESTTVIEPKNPLNQLKYDNKIDFYCKMDITKYGVSDTTHYKGKLYGFCSTMCKNEFLMKPEEYLAKQ
ncbi:YHS domain-containing protein [Flavobacterium marginilacus]|uniref:YHS domain-containing protein n=1 Tax=Flavobacterium marginilacus TaxID=3003256 RepID=UPI00248E1C15|nr:YHS domain-containing protein [Flavobacterium marginilacus]